VGELSLLSLRARRDNSPVARPEGLEPTRPIPRDTAQRCNGSFVRWRIRPAGRGYKLYTASRGPGPPGTSPFSGGSWGPHIPTCESSNVKAVRSFLQRPAFERGPSFRAPKHRSQRDSWGGTSVVRTESALAAPNAHPHHADHRHRRTVGLPSNTKCTRPVSTFLTNGPQHPRSSSPLLFRRVKSDSSWAKCSARACSSRARVDFSASSKFSARVRRSHKAARPGRASGEGAGPPVAGAAAIGPNGSPPRGLPWPRGQEVSDRSAERLTFLADMVECLARLPNLGV